MPLDPVIQDLRAVVNTSMGSATALSPAVDLMGYRVSAISFSSGWDAANRMTFQGSYDYGTATSPTWRDHFDSVGNEWQIASGSVASATGRIIALDPDVSLAISSMRYLRFRSGPSSAPANPSTAIALSIILAPF